jgi:hypothetical protein
MLRLACLTTLLAAAAACNAYDPQLPEVPYLCGTSDPKCPDGYRAVQITMSRCECWKDDGTGSADSGIDSGPFVCADDTRESNDNITEATPTAITGTGSNSTIFEDMTICTSDVDVFKMTINMANTGIEVVVDFTQIDEEVDVDILNSSGDSIASGTSAGSGRMRAFTTAGVTGTYYAQVRSGNNSENAYRIVMMISPP